MNAKYLYDQLSKLTDEERNVTEVVYVISPWDLAPTQMYLQEPEDLETSNGPLHIPGYVFIRAPVDWLKERFNAMNIAPGVGPVEADE